MLLSRKYSYIYTYFSNYAYIHIIVAAQREKRRLEILQKEEEFQKYQQQLPKHMEGSDSDQNQGSGPTGLGYQNPSDTYENQRRSNTRGFSNLPAWMTETKA